MRLFLAIVFFLPALAMADDQATSDMRLTIKPVLCITDSRNPDCDMSFLVIWQTGDSGYYCLFNDLIDAAVRCWNEERAGRLNDDRIVRESFSYWMTGSDPDSRLAEVAIEVLRMDSDDRRRRRRTRHVWDIN